jgi:tetratricopeptide (TPR) repeat protein
MSRLDPTPPVLDQHDSLYAAGAKLVWRHLQLANRDPKALSLAVKLELKDGIAKLKSAIEVRPDHRKNWSTFWLLGKAYEALGEFENSYQCFKSAFEINQKHVDVARELMASCLRTGRIAEAVHAAKIARDLAPLNPGVIANLALAFFKHGQLDEALSTGREALRLAPSDSITRSLVARIEQVHNGASPSSL